MVLISIVLLSKTLEESKMKEEKSKIIETRKTVQKKKTISEKPKKQIKVFEEEETEII